MSQSLVRKCSIEDAKPLKELAWTTFYDTYHAYNDPDNFANYMNKAFSLKQITTELENTNILYYVAVSHGTFVGYVKLNFAPVQTDVHDKTSIEIERIYILSNQKRKGIGKLLLQQSIEVAQQHQLKYIWLGVWQKNPKAIAFYKSQGFEIFDTHYFMMDKEPQKDWLMRLNV